jgi:hypothetical protein
VILRGFQVFFAAVVLAVFLDGIRFRQVYATISTGNHAGYGWFSGRVIFAGSQSTLDDFQYQPQSEQDNDKAYQLTHNYLGIVIGSG